ncbi:MAG: DEAD/DEAH box helicase [Propionibacteriaceae bacterium]|jgi:ATP-dependent RNA helicase HelY|nr:DEAD/DEAH box helicase [Propionibacteriaceae bacterium]
MSGDLAADVALFAQGFPFALDSFQLEACQAVAGGKGALVAAPTGAGKTVVGEFACFLALRTGRKCFYTTPIKALSNQKYRDLCARHGEQNVGLLTGDISVNGEAPVVVMTTEVLRNMIYASSPTLRGLGFVVLDEVHYLADRFRGAVWEEVIITLEESVRVIALSATVSNAEEFGAWLDEVRGDTAIVLWEQRPVPLFQHVMAGRDLYDLFDQRVAALSGAAAAPVSGEVNPKLLQLAKQETRALRDDSRRPRGRSGNGKRASYGSGRYGGAADSRRREANQRLVPRRDATIERLSAEGLLPAIYFIFSRQGCDTAVSQLMRSGPQLTNSFERVELDEIASRHAEGLSTADLAALDYGAFCDAFRCGIAAHHAGMFPAFKAATEEGFGRGLVKVVFATETLALGINMPARSVVLEKLVKFNGEHHADITAGEYTQLTGRAGRRGIDVEGHAVVNWQPGLDPRAVAGLASRRTYPLRSSFQPTYNMAANFVATVGRAQARQLLERSFAQYQADATLQRYAQRSRRNRDTGKSRLRTNTIAVRFDRICSVLESLGYLTAGGQELTADGRMLTRIYSELDLVVAEAVKDGVFAGLSGPGLAAVVSSLVYESRGDRRVQHRMPNRASEKAQSELRGIWRRVSLVERDNRLPGSPEPDIGFAEAVFDWASGRPLGEVLDESELTAGDFVRNARQVVDALDQLGEASPVLRASCKEAAGMIRRSVVDANYQD